VDSLSSISTSILDSDSSDLSDAQREWEASLEQLQLLLTMIVMPFAGKFLGRKFAYWSKCPPLRLGVGCEESCLLTCYPLSCRLGEVHGMDAQRRDPVDEQGGIQRRRRRRGCGIVMTRGVYRRGGTMSTYRHIG
jgi:hypothetical protein